MGGEAQATAPDLKHIGPIDPDASTLKQFLNLFRRATAIVLVDGGKVQGEILAHCGTHYTGRATGSRQRGGRPRT
jgi:hypothetical protein